MEHTADADSGRVATFVDPQSTSHSARQRRPLLLAGMAGVVILGLVAAGAMTGLIPAASSEKGASPTAQPSDDARRQARAGTRAAGACANCGTVEAVRPVQLEKKTVHRVTVRMDDGSYRTISQPVAPGIGPGEKVQIVDGAVVAGR
jgi:outer membrane lipoprotein SlyB